MPVVAGAPTYKALVKMYDGRHVDADELVCWEGPPTWKLEPLDPAAAAEWRETRADPIRVEHENLRTKVIVRAPKSPAEIAADAERKRQMSRPIRMD